MIFLINILNIQVSIIFRVIWYIYCGAQGFDNLDPFHIKPKAHTEEEEMSEDERRRSKLPGDVAGDNPILGELRSRKEKAACHQGQSPKASQGKVQVQRDSHERIVEEQF